MVEINSSNGGNLGFEKKLWVTADKMKQQKKFKQIELGDCSNGR